MDGMANSTPEWVSMVFALECGICYLPCRPSCFRFPRGNGVGIDLAAEGISDDLKGTPLEV